MLKSAPASLQPSFPQMVLCLKRITFLTPVIASFCSLKEIGEEIGSAFQNLFLLSYLWKYHIIILRFFFQIGKLCVPILNNVNIDAYYPEDLFIDKKVFKVARVEHWRNLIQPQRRWEGFFFFPSLIQHTISNCVLRSKTHWSEAS